MAGNDNIVDRSISPGNDTSANENQESLSIMESIEEKDAKIRRLERDLEVILDENNLLHLELQDVQKTTEESISKLNYELSAAKRKNSELESCLTGIKTITKKLNRELAKKKAYRGSVKETLIKLCELALIPEIDDTVNENCTNSTNTVSNESGKDQVIQPQETPTTPTATINNADIISVNPQNKNTLNVKPMPKLSTQPSSTVIDSSNTKPCETVPLRRSGRNSVVTGQFGVEIKSLGVSNLSMKKQLKSSSKAIPLISRPMPQLKAAPIKVKSESTTHAVDTFNQNGFYCVCGRQYTTKQKLNLHIRQNTWEWKFNCKVCGLNFFEACRFKKHMRKIHGEQIMGSHGCYHCGEMFLNRKELFFHQKLTHDCGPLVKEKSNTAKAVPAKKVRAWNKINHSRNRKTGIRGSKRMKNQATALADLNTNSINQDVSSENYTLNTHHKVDASKSKQGYYCICGTNFTTKTGMNVHIKYFTYEAKFACSKCERKFFSTCLLRTHMKAKHNIIYAGLNGCRRCGRCFSSRLQLYQHCKNVHKSGPLMVSLKRAGEKSLISDDNESLSLERQGGDIKNETENDNDRGTTRKRKLREKSGTQQSRVLMSQAKNKRTTSPLKISQRNNSTAQKGHSLLAKVETEKDANEEEDTTYEINLGELEMSGAQSVSVKHQIENMPDPSSSKNTKQRKRPSKYKTKTKVDKCKNILVAASHSQPDKIFKRRGPGRPPKNLESTHHKVAEEGKTKCTCGKNFNSPSSLLSHVKLKTRGSAHKCRLCSKGFPRGDYLRRHLLIVHGKVKGGRLGKQNKKSVIHGVLKSDEEIKCLCGVQFRSQVTLHEHLRLKIGKRVFQCELCPESFSRYDYFKDHLKRVHQMTCEGMACRDCGARGFPTHKELREHRMNFHEKKIEKKQEQVNSTVC